jgi:hypothetical protein
LAPRSTSGRASPRGAIAALAQRGSGVLERRVAASTERYSALGAPAAISARGRAVSGAARGRRGARAHGGVVRSRDAGREHQRRSLPNLPLIEGWAREHGIRRLSWRKAAIEDVAGELNALPPMPVLVSCVHAPLPLDEVLDQLRWDVAFTLACCVPGHQLSRRHTPLAEGSDPSVLSEGRRFQVLINPAPGSGGGRRAELAHAFGRGAATPARCRS